MSSSTITVTKPPRGSEDRRRGRGRARHRGQADVSSVPDIERLYDAAVEEFGRIDIVVATRRNGQGDHPVHRRHRRGLRLAVAGQHQGAVLRPARGRPADRRDRRIVTISSNTTTVPQVGVALYGTSKIATSYLVRGSALELGARGVTVNTVVPGPIDNAGIFTEPSNDKYKQSLIDMTPIGRLETRRMWRPLPRSSPATTPGSSPVSRSSPTAECTRGEKVTQATNARGAGPEGRRPVCECGAPGAGAEARAACDYRLYFMQVKDPSALIHLGEKWQ